MKTLLVLFAFSCLPATLLHAECAYFRTSAKLQKCTAEDPKKHREPNPYEESSDLPDLPSTESKVMARVLCNCQYVLKGSGLLCDTDQSMEQSALIGGDTLPEICRQGRVHCKEICPKALP